MRIIELESRTPEKLDRLLEIWERSVRATHSFLSGGEVEAIKAYVPQAMGEVPHLVVAEDEGGDPAGFLGAGGQRLEMLFLSGIPPVLKQTLAGKSLIHPAFPGSEDRF